MEDRTARGAQHDDAGSGTHRRPRTRPQDGHPDRRRAPLPTRVEDLPDLPPAYEAALDDGLRELRLELPASVRRAIGDHVRLLLAWTVAINLTAVREPAAAARLHVIDSLTAVEPLRAAGVRQLLDLGSGGGFPGLPLAVALPADRALLVDSVARKVRFLQAAIGAIGAGDPGASGRIVAAAARAEQLARDPAHRERWDAVTARAVAGLPELVELALPLVRVGGRLVAWKRAEAGSGRGMGRALEAEIAAAGPILEPVGALGIEIHDPGVRSLPGHVLVVVRKASPTDPRYPREPRLRRRPQPQA